MYSSALLVGASGDPRYRVLWRSHQVEGDEIRRGVHGKLTLPIAHVSWTVVSMRGNKATRYAMAWWVLRSVLGWLGVGVILGFVSISIIVNVWENLVYQACLRGVECGEGGGREMAMLFSPIIGAAWGIAAGLIGSLVGLVWRSQKLYAGFMVTAAVSPFVLLVEATRGSWFLVDGKGSWLLTGLSALMGSVSGIVVWAIARRLSQPLATGPCGHRQHQSRAPSS